MLALVHPREIGHLTGSLGVRDPSLEWNFQHATLGGKGQGRE